MSEEVILGMMMCRCGGKPCVSTTIHNTEQGEVVHDIHIYCDKCGIQTAPELVKEYAIEKWNNVMRGAVCKPSDAHSKVILKDGTEVRDYHHVCSICNEHIEDSDNFCPSCGAQVVR